MTEIAWIAVDWGTSSLRAWGMNSSGQIAVEAKSDKGMGGLERSGFEPALLELIAGWLRDDRQTTVIACGMVGARQGWIEVPYQQAPCAPVFRDCVGRPVTRDQRLSVVILPGIKQLEPADVMRGEETQIAGLLLDCPDFDGVLCLPGTHTKWVKVKNGEIVEFQTFMTGELFNLLSAQSILRHSMRHDTWRNEAFIAGLSAVFSHPETFASQLFSIRAASIVSDLDPNAAYARLSGILIGTELAAARRYWQDADVTIIGNGQQADIYANGLRVLGKATEIVPTESITLAGLKAAHAQIIERRE